jgi:hypothetical protein
MLSAQELQRLFARKYPLAQAVQVKLPALFTEQLLQLVIVQGMHCICAL